MTKASDNAFPSLLITEGTEPSAPAAGKQRMYIDSTTHLLMLTNSSGTETVVGASGSGTVSLVRNTAQRDSTSTSLADVTGLTFSVLSGVTYRFRFVVYFFTAAATTGLRLAVNGPAMTAIRYGGYIPSSASSNAVGIAIAQVSAVDTSIFATTSGPGATPVMAIVEGTCIPSAGGTLALRFATEVAASTVSIEAGSYGELVQF